MESVLSAFSPRGAVPGARIELTGSRLPLPADGPPRVWVGAHEARVTAASARAITVIVPRECDGGPTPVRVEGVDGETLVLEIARVLTTEVHQVDSPVCAPDGSVYVTNSGNRDAKAPVPLSRIRPDGTREPMAVDIANPTSLAIGPDAALYVSSRFEGSVFRIDDRGHAELFATDLGVATGLAFAADGTLFVGDRSGSILRISAGQQHEPKRHVETFASLPASIAAFHLTMGPDGCLYVTAPTLASRDVVYRISPGRQVDVLCHGLGRPQGLAFDAAGSLFVADALAGSAGLYRVDVSATAPVPELVVAAPQLVGVASHPHGGLVLASSDTVWRL